MESKPEKLINACPNCGEVMDVSACAPFSKVMCPACAQAIRVRSSFHHFSILRQIGEGGMSRVFLARDETLNREVALKILNPTFSTDDYRVKQFEREAKMTASVRHPNVVSVYSVGQDQNHFFIAMELVGQGSLDDRLHAQGKLSEAEVLEIGLGITEGLKAAFELGLIHRDIKPGNILFSNTGDPKLVDFGLALMFEQDRDESGEIWATPFYVPLEKLNKEPEDFRSDIFSLGATLFHALSGHPPHQANSSSIDELRAIKSRPVRMMDHAPRASANTCELIDRMMARDPSDRHGSYEELLEHLAFAKSELGSSGSRKQAFWGIRPAFLFTSIGVSLVAVALLLAWAGGAFRKDSPERENGTVTENTIRVEKGQKTLARRYVEARSDLFAGRLTKARAEFEKILGDSATPQPTLNWARVKLGITSLLMGDAVTASRSFAELKANAQFSTEFEDQSLVEFFRLIGGELAGGSRIDLASQNNFPASEWRGMLWLGFGVNDWHLGAYDSAEQWFGLCMDEPASNGEPWVKETKSFAKRLQRDSKLLAHLPEFSTNLGLPETQAALRDLEKISAQLSANWGTVPKNLQTLESQFKTHRDSLQKSKVKNEASHLAAIREKEHGRLIELKENLRAFRGTIRFGEAVQLIQSQAFEHPDIKKEADQLLSYYAIGQDFFHTLGKDLTRLGYIGTIKAKNGIAASVKLIGGTENEVIRFNQGSPQNVPFSVLQQRSILDLALSLSERLPDMSEHLKRRELCAFFAYHIGETTSAMELRDELLPFLPDFASRWHNCLRKQQ